MLIFLQSMKTNNKDIFYGNVLRDKLFFSYEMIVGNIGRHYSFKVFLEHVEDILGGYPKGLLLEGK